MTGKVTALQPGDASNVNLYPVITVTAWQDLSIINVILIILAAIVLFLFAIVYYRRYIDQNRMSVLEASVENWKKN